MKKNKTKELPLPAGKLDSDILKDLILDKIRTIRPELLVGAGIGEDCAVVSLGDKDLLISTDPITASIKDIGRLAIHISCNDIAAKGGEPVVIMLACMLPEGIREEDIDEIMDQAVRAAEEINVQIGGGHTEITGAVTKPVIVTTAFGFIESGKWATAGDMKPGDKLLLTKTAGLEGTAIICADREDELKSVLTDEEIERGKALVKDISVVKEGLIAGRIGTSGMHDITEGGVLSAVWEMCNISGLGAKVYEEKIPVNPVTLKLAEYYGIEWKRLISSGCMLISARPDKADHIREKISAEGIGCREIGEVSDKKSEILLIGRNGDETAIAPPGADEIYKII
jgi:hydrogenase expression/formation protein HypE